VEGPRYEALRGARIVATLPSPEENGGWFNRAALQQIAALRAHGAEVFPFDVSYVHTGDIRLLFKQISELNAFRPEMVVSTPTAMHALHCKTGNIVLGDGRYVPNNLFIDNLKLPTILIWDTFTELFVTLGITTLDPARSRGGVLADMRAQINDPLYYHCAFDQQHVDTMRALGALTTPNVRVRLARAYPHHVAFGLTEPESGYDEDVAFTGNLFSPRPPRGDDEVRPIIRRLLELVLERYERDPDTTYWDAIEAARAELGEDACGRARLTHDQSFFWEYLCVDIMSSVISHTRMHALQASRRPVSIYGLMFDPQSVQLLRRYPHLAAKGAADYITELPRLNRRTKVTLDVVTSHFPTSTTAKILNCFVSGGMCLFDAKPAFREAFGSPADQVMYRGHDDMNAKLDYLLTHERERAELVEYFQAKVRAEHTSIGLLAELVAWVKETHA
jgi:hypothetical protein